jgi:peptidoglycan hydrolase CwlO-like protein
VSFTQFIPGFRDRGKHDPDVVIERLRDENRRLLTIVAGSDDAFALLRQRCAEAEELVVQLQADKEELTEERNQLVDEVRALRDELAPHRAAEANVNAVTVPPMERDTSAVEDQATAPIDVRTLREAADAGLLDTRPSDTDTQPLRTVKEAS